MLYRTAPGGREWFNRWNEGAKRTITWGQDSVDPEFIVRGNSNCVIYGKDGDKAGQIKVAGPAPRLYVRGSPSEDVPPPAGTPKWNNVEVTFYAKTTDAGARLGYAGLEAVCRTNHFPDSDDLSTRGYGGRILFDGRIDIEKELSHGKKSNIRSAPVFVWTQADGGLLSDDSSLEAANGNRPVYQFPMNKWIGYKLVARNCDNDSAVLVEVYVDRTDGKNGGDWQLAKSVKDIAYDPARPEAYFSKELWHDAGDFKSKGSADPSQHGMPITSPGHSIYLRTDGNTEQFYRFFSIREIEPVKK